VFGETGLVAAMRGPDGRPAGLNPGATPRQHLSAEAPVLIEAARTINGTVALRGPMVPAGRFPRIPDDGPDPGIDPAADPPFAAALDGFLDTAYPCRILPGSGSLVVTGPPAGLVAVGGYRLILAKLQDAARGIDPAAMMAAFPDALTGQRIAGVAAQPDEIRAALAALGLGPLAANAFRPRRAGEARNAA
jgi:hypothetical protein